MQTLFQTRFEQCAQLIERFLIDVMVVQPIEFFRIPLCRRIRQIGQVKPFDELRTAENFIVAMSPAQTRQIIAQGFRQIAQTLVVHHGGGVAAFGQLFAVRPENHRDVAVLRQRRAERGQYIDLFGGIAHMVVAANHVRDAHVPIVHHDAEIIGWRAIGAGDNPVVQLNIVDSDFAFDHVIPDHCAIQRVFEAYHRLNTFGNCG